ncbi:MAG: hypothetical protein JXB48_23965 [Candidatus Latescibacteria bacterium]|nr:hypothetical protein [Candidatus Latescibacterota bacterium]
MTDIFIRILTLSGLIFLFTIPVFSQDTPKGTAWIDCHGYSKCIQLFNNDTKVVLEPNCGGRVIEYSLNGQNSIFVDPAHDGWMYTPGKRTIDPCGGRLDIGPEMTIPNHNDIWVGTWSAEITGPYTARLTSVKDKATGVQLIREFKLNADNSHLKCTQIIKNIGNETKQYYHWSRTLAEGNGIFLVPLNPDSRFPRGYIIYGPGPVMNYDWRDPQNVEVRDGYLIVTGEPPQPQIGLDSYDGWLAYITRGNLLFIKKFPMYPDRIYSDMAATTVMIYYYKDKMCELEPMGPRETIRPGKSVSYTEDWWLLPYEYPKGGVKINPSLIKEMVFTKTK